MNLWIRLLPRGESRIFKRGREGGGGHTTSAEGARFLGRFGEMLPQKVLKISVSETAISYSFNRIRDVFVKK